MYKVLFASAKDGMTFFGERTSALVNAFLLAIVYLFGIGIMNILSRVMRKKFLELDTVSARKSYWVKIREKPEGIRRYYRQF